MYLAVWIEPNFLSILEFDGEAPDVRNDRLLESLPHLRVEAGLPLNGTSLPDTFQKLRPQLRVFQCKDEADDAIWHHARKFDRVPVASKGEDHISDLGWESVKPIGELIDTVCGIALFLMANRAARVVVVVGASLIDMRCCSRYRSAHYLERFERRLGPVTCA